MYWLFGSVVGCLFKRCVNGVRGSLGWSCPVTCKKKKNKISHQERRARAKAKVGTFRRQALAVALVVRCRRRLYNKPLPSVSLSSVSEQVRWKWKEKNSVGLDSVMTRLKPSTLESFCTGSHDFLRLPRLMGTLCNYDYPVKQIKLALD